MNFEMRIAIIGPGKRFLSGITYYTMALANALGADHEVSVIELRRLLPRFLFPGRARVGKELTQYGYVDGVRVYDGVDWYLIPSILGAFRALGKSDYIIIQWWTSSVAHVYLTLRLYAFLSRKKVIIEFHEVLDPLEQKSILLRIYSRLMAKLIFGGCFAYVAHSMHERDALAKRFALDGKKFRIVPHASCRHMDAEPGTDADPAKCNILFFGLIRPYKGVRYLLDAFQKLDDSRFSLTIAGEPWDKSMEEMIPEGVRYIPRYLADEEVAGEFCRADVVVLPYTRATQSGVASMATEYGLHLVVTPVGGLRESLEGYEGTVYVKEKDPGSIAEALNGIYDKRRMRFPMHRTMRDTAAAYKEVLG